MLDRTKERIIDELYYNYVEKGHYQKYDPDYSLSTWIVNYIYLNINNLVRSRNPLAQIDHNVVLSPIRSS